MGVRGGQYSPPLGEFLGVRGGQYSPPLGGVRGDFNKIMHLLYNRNLKSLSRQLRANFTDAEKLLWSKIRKKQIKNYQFFRQKPIGNYIVDFYCNTAKLVIEIDGGQHYEDENAKNDKIRESFLEKHGLRIMRFTNLDVLKNIENVVEKIYREV